MDKEMLENLKKMKIIMVFISILMVVFYLSQVNIAWNVELQPITRDASVSSSIMGWIFAGIVFGMIYFSFLFLIALIVWIIFNRKHPEVKNLFTTRTKSGGKYDEQLEELGHTLIYVCLIEVLVITCMYIFGIIKI